MYGAVGSQCTFTENITLTTHLLTVGTWGQAASKSRVDYFLFYYTQLISRLMWKFCYQIIKLKPSYQGK